MQRMEEPTATVSVIPNCNDSLTDVQIQHVRLSVSISSAVCLVIITFIFLLLIFYKAYTTTLQRLFLYLTITTVIQEASMTMEFEHQFQYSGQETFCKYIIIISEWTNTMVYGFTLGIIVYLLYKFYEQIRRKPFSRQLKSKCFRVSMECLFIFIVLMYPGNFPWVRYSDIEQWCKNRTIGDNCTTVDSTNQILKYIFHDTVGVFGAVVAIVLSFVFCCLACKHRETRRYLMTTLRRTFIFLGFFIVCVTFETIALTFDSLYTELGGESYAWWMVYAAMFPIIQLIIPIGFLFYLYSFNLFRWRAIKRAAVEWRCFHSCCGKEDVSRVPGVGEAATAPSSHCVAVPSVSFFIVPYTGAFTDVSVEERQTLLSDVSGDRGHGSAISAV